MRRVRGAFVAWASRPSTRRLSGLRSAGDGQATCVQPLFAYSLCMGSTQSERVFEQFCQENSIRFSRVEVEINTKSPDYEIFPQENRVVLEVKELQENGDDRAAWAQAARSRTHTAFSDPRDRIRRKIKKAAKQLKRRSEGLHPTIVVLFDNGTFGGIDATDIKNAMYGDEVVQVTSSSRDDMRVVRKLGGGAKCTATDHRSVSAVAALATIGTTIRLSVFHNVFAARPLPFDWLPIEACRQYSLDLQCEDGFSEWHPVPSLAHGRKIPRS